MLSPQDIDNNNLIAAHKNGWVESKAADVYHQLLPDFPGHSIAWVKHTPWFGPMRIPLASIDFTNRANWVASHEPDKVKMHIKLIQEGKSEPIILGKFVGHDKYFCIDAHHRLLAYEALRAAPLAYVGIIAPRDAEAALTAHSQQYSGQSKLDGVNPRLDGI